MAEAELMRVMSCDCDLEGYIPLSQVCLPGAHTYNVLPWENYVWKTCLTCERSIDTEHDTWEEPY